MHNFRMIDDAAAAQVVSVQFIREQKPDAHADLSHLEQDYDDCEPEEAAKYRAQDKERLAALERGDWYMRGLYVSAAIRVPVGSGSFACYDMQSPGVWGVESDCGADTEKEIWDNEEATLRQHLACIGAAAASLFAPEGSKPHA